MDSTQVLLVHLLVLSLVGAGAQDLNSDRAALLALREAVGRTVLPWKPAATPCSWRGVSCRYGRVAALRLPGSGLIGQIPESTVGNLTGLRTLSLRLNAISGPLPSDLSKATELRNLYLQGNRFSGGFPSPIVSLPRLIRLNLADNELTGEIPAALNNLTRITTLFLENNDLSGSIPDLDLPSLTQLNVSFNNLSGSIPARLRKMPTSAYLGMKKLCGGPLGPCPGEAVPSPAPAPAPTTLPATKPVPVGPTRGGGAIGPGGDGGGNGNSNNGRSGGSSKLSGGAIAGIAVGSALGLLLLLALLIFMCRRKRDGESKTRAAELSTVPKPLEAAAEPGRNDNRAADSGAAVEAAMARGENGDVKKLVFVGGKEGEFDLEELLRASAEVLGKGTFGTTYKAILEMGAVVAVKRLRDVTLVEPEFQKQIEAIGVMDHPNLVPLRAYYHSKDEKLLVYDYMPMGSLSALLHGNSGSGRTPLNWETRSGIALATARGIAYIHSTGPDASHGNIKSSNILLDKSKDARVSDHGLAHFVISSSPTRGSGYRAPEVSDAQKVSQKADVYSFGVLLLELLTGKAPLQAILSEEGVDLPRWVQSIVREEWTSEVFDPELLRYQSVEEMEQLLQLAIDCAAQYPDKRPSMAEVAVQIEEVRQSSLGPRDQKQKLHQQHTVDDGDDWSSRHTESS